MVDRPKNRKKVMPREILSAGWIVFITFLIGFPIVFFEYAEQHKFRDVILFVYLFLEFLPMLAFISSIALPHLTPHLLLPWIIINIILILISSILVLSLSISYPSLTNVLISLGISVFFIFPVLFVIIMYLPLIVYTKKLVPNYKKKIKRSKIYRVIFRNKTEEEIEREIIWRRKEQVKNTIVTDRDFDQFIMVNKAAKKWRSKLKTKQTEEIVKFEEEVDHTETVNKCFELDTVYEEGGVIKNANVTLSDNEAIIDNGDFVPQQTVVVENGKIVTDV